MARKQHLAILAASLVSLGACTSKPPALEQSVLTSSADVALIIANQIENSQLIENAQVSSVNPNIKNWYLSEQFFGGMHGSGDLQKPREGLNNR
ncbi:MAG: hypothetical protein KAI85_03345, partial [Halopseudomonas aestusnigri]|nr:hypothetical protein [Halopseudomonas aestusnigri]